MKKLEQLTIIGLGLLGSSLALAEKNGRFTVKTVGFSHRSSTRKKARRLAVCDEVCDDIGQAVANADIVVLATPICTFQQMFKAISPFLKKGCIITDVGSTKMPAHKWAKKHLPKDAFYVGSHPIAGSEQRGVDSARDDLFYNAACIVTKDNSTNAKACKTIKEFWAGLGCRVSVMNPEKHDKILANVSHLPHAIAAALLNASDLQQLKLCGKGFVDTSRIASGPANVWADIFYTNSTNICKGIDSAVKQMKILQKAIRQKDKALIEKLLDNARNKRAKLINYKVSKKEIM